MSDLPPLRDVIAAHGLGAKKTLGQHFLLDLNLTDKIVRLAEIDRSDHVLEIGPGPGGLTRALLKTGAKVTAIERDKRCIDILAEISDAFPGQLSIVEGDALQFDEWSIRGTEDPIKIVSNLPYNISTELLIKWLKHNQTAEQPLWSSMALMFQKEVADRILAEPDNKTFGRLSIVAQASSAPRRAFDLPARAFTPPPKVDSSVVCFDANETPLKTLSALEHVTQAAFSNRRKMLRSSLKAVFNDRTEQTLQDLAIEGTRRGETLTIEDFLNLSKALAKQKEE